MNIDYDVKLRTLLGNSIDEVFLATKSDNTKKTYIKYINDYFKTVTLEDITIGQIYSTSSLDAQLYLNNLLKEGFQPGSINQRRIALSHFYDFLKEKNLLNTNPFNKQEGVNVVNLSDLPRSKLTLDYLLKFPISEWPDYNVNRVIELKQLVSNENGLNIGFGSLLRYFPVWKNKTIKRYTSFLNALAEFRIGLVPDFRITRSIPKMNTNVILFSLEKYEKKNDVYSAAYALASFNLKLGVMVSKVDGIVVEEETALLNNQIESWPSLNSLEKKRLQLYLDWLLSNTVNNKGINSGSRSLSTYEKGIIGDWLIEVSKADGIVRPEEMYLMEKLYLKLNLNVNELHKKIGFDIYKVRNNRSHEVINKGKPTATELLDFLLDYIQ